MSQVILKRITVEELRLSYPTRATLKVPTALRSPMCQEGDVLHGGNFRGGDTCHFRRAAGASDVAGASARSCWPRHGTIRWPRAAPSGQTAPPRPPAGTGSATCPDGACAARGSAQGLPPLPGSAAVSEPGVCGPAGLTPQPLRAQAGRDRRRAEETETPCLGLDTSSSRVPLLRPSAPSSRLSSWSSWLGAAVDLDDSVLP